MYSAHSTSRTRKTEVFTRSLLSNIPPCIEILFLVVRSAQLSRLVPRTTYDTVPQGFRKRIKHRLHRNRHKRMTQIRSPSDPPLILCHRGTAYTVPPFLRHLGVSHDQRNLTHTHTNIVCCIEAPKLKHLSFRQQD